MTKPRWGENVQAAKREPDSMEEARGRACLWSVSSSAGLLCLCVGESVARAVAAALGAETVEVGGPCPNTDRRQLSLLGGKTL
ncbi:MAG TPA: hypothetical protein DEB56_11155 [Thiobacillus sp.]|nr:hypothetical protein [Thiobacillus sp.]